MGKSQAKKKKKRTTAKRNKKPVQTQLNDFLQAHNLGIEDLQRVFREYATTPPERARTYFKEQNSWTEHTFYRARDLVVICMLLDDRETVAILNKLAGNYSSHNKSHRAKGSIQHSIKLMEERQEFFRSFPKEEIITMLHKYAEGTSIEIIANQFGIGESCVKKLLAKGLYYEYISGYPMVAISRRLKKSGHTVQDAKAYYAKKMF